MYALIAIVVQALVTSAAALAITPYSLSAGASSWPLWTLCMASTVLSTLGLVATSSYLSRRIRPMSGAFVGLSCGLVCSAIVGMVIRGKDFSLIIYFALLAPTLLAVLLATLLDRPKSGWQT